MPILCFAQQNKDKTIIVKGVSFLQVCNSLLDSGYAIKAKDNDLQTVSTEMKQYPKHWNASYSISVRVKDSVAYFTVFFSSNSSTIFRNTPAEFVVNKKGVVEKSIYTYPMRLVDQFAKQFGAVTYSK